MNRTASKMCLCGVLQGDTRVHVLVCVLQGNARLQGRARVQAAHVVCSSSKSVCSSFLTVLLLLKSPSFDRRLPPVLLDEPLLDDPVCSGLHARRVRHVRHLHWPTHPCWVCLIVKVRHLHLPFLIVV